MKNIKSEKQKHDTNSEKGQKKLFLYFVISFYPVYVLTLHLNIAKSATQTSIYTYSILPPRKMDCKR